MKVAVIFNNYGPYHIARMNSAGKVLDAYGIELFGKSSEYAWTKEWVSPDRYYHHITLFDGTDEQIKSSNLKEKLYQALDRINPDAVAINGWAEAGAFFALKWCGEKGVPAIVMSDSTEFDAPRNLVKELVKKQLVSRFSAALVAGKLHVSYMEQLGMQRNRIFTKYDVVDNEYFSNFAGKVRENELHWRTKLSLPERYFLVSARFVEKKNLDRVIEAYAGYCRKAGENPWDLVIVGDGPNRDRLQSLIDSLGIRKQVHLPGFRQMDVLPAYYALAKVFVHASTVEQWGLVVNEALASGLPVLLSDRCGCGPDLVESGVNGFLFDPFSVQDLTEKMVQIAANEYKLPKMGAESSRIIGSYGTAQFAASLKAAAKCALDVKPRKGLLSGVALQLMINK